jgi:hypothetical protein
MKDEEERNKLYELEKKVVEKGQDFYNSLVRNGPGDDPYLKFYYW